MNVADEPPTELRPADTTRHLLRRVLLRAGLAFLAATTLTLVAAHWWPLKYTGVTMFTLRSDSAGSSSRAPGNESLDAVKLTLPHDLMSQEAFEKVIRDLGLEKGLPHDSQGALTREGQQAHQAMVAELRQQTQLVWEVKSPQVDLLAVSVSHEDPNLARDIPNVLVKNYIERTSALILDRLMARDRFLLSQVNACTARLVEAENHRTAFEVQYARMMPDSPGAGQKRIDDIEAEMRKLSLDMLTAQNKLRDATARIVTLSELFPQAADSLSAQDAEHVKALIAGYRKSQPASRPAAEPASPAAPQPETPPAGEEPIEIVKGPNPERVRLEEQLRELEQTLVAEKTLRHKTDAQPDVKALQARIAQLKKQVEDTPAEVVIQKLYRYPTSQPDAPKARLTDAQTVAVMGNALREWNLAAAEYKRVSDELGDKKARRDGMVVLMANFAVIRQKWGELTKKAADCTDELKRWQDEHNGIQIALVGEVAKKRTHMETVQAAQEQFVPESPSLLRILAGALCVALLAIHWAISPLVTVGRKAVAVVWVLLASAALLMLLVHPLAVLLLTGSVAISAMLAAALDRRMRSRRGAFLVVLVTILIMGAAAVAMLSITLKLQFPDIYQQWQSDPLAFLYNNGLTRIIESINPF